MGFKKWLDLQENGTCTASVAFFARPMLPVVRRLSPVDFLSDLVGQQFDEPEDGLASLFGGEDEDEDEPKKKKKGKKSKSKKKSSKKKKDD